MSPGSLRPRASALRRRPRAAEPGPGLCGIQLGEHRRLRPATPVQTLTEAQQRANNLYRRLTDRGAHGQVLSYCTAELLEDNYFHAVLEATKGCSSGCGSRWPIWPGRP
jgi:hypothetical protein